MSFFSARHLPCCTAAVALSMAGAGAAPGVQAQALAAQAQALPSFSELEAAGVRIGRIEVRPMDIFDTSDPAEDRLLFRAANRLHKQTRPEVITRALLFKEGEPVSARLIDETERQLRSKRYLYDVHIRPVTLRDGVVDIEVETRDTWTLDPGISVGRSGGSNSGGISLREYNLLGSGVAISLGRSSNVDRSSTELALSTDRLMGSHLALGLSHAQNSDGRRDAVSLVRPFYQLEARWAAGLSLARDDRIDPVYAGGKQVAGFRHREERAEVFGGWSAGLVNGWVKRYSVGLALREDSYAQAPGEVPPARLAQDQKLVSPFLRYELLEDRYERLNNRNLIGRPEFFSLGLATTVQLGWAGRGLGSSRDALLYSASASRGFEPEVGRTLIAAASVSGRLEAGRVRDQRLGAQLQYYRPQGPRWLFYAAAHADLLTRPDPNVALPIGGDNGLRGYPLRYQNGQRRALFTVEERFYTDVYLWRLFRLGGAAYVDVGRAWGGESPGSATAPWLGDAGLGLRIVSARAAFSNVLHVDLAMPLNAPADVKKLQFLVKTRSSF